MTPEHLAAIGTVRVRGVRDRAQQRDRRVDAVLTAQAVRRFVRRSERIRG